MNYTVRWVVLNLHFIESNPDYHGKQTSYMEEEIFWAEEQDRYGKRTSFIDLNSGSLMRPFI